MRISLIINAVLLVFPTAYASNAPDSVAEFDKQFLLSYPNLENSGGEVLLENEHVVVQRFIVGPGEWEGLHDHPGNQVYVHVKGGKWSGRAGGKPTYTGSHSEDGAVGWMDEIPLSEEHESGNTGEDPIDLIWVTLKDDAPIAPDAQHAPLAYPNVPLELLLENDRVIVQRVQIEPGQWEGAHAHPGNQLYVHIKGGIWSARENGVQTPPFPYSDTGSVGWMDAIDQSVGHESGNTGDTTIDLVWITLK